MGDFIANFPDYLQQHVRAIVGSAIAGSICLFGFTACDQMEYHREPVPAPYPKTSVSPPDDATGPSSTVRPANTVFPLKPVARKTTRQC